MVNSNKFNSTASSTARTTSLPFEAEYFGGLKVRGSIARDVVRVEHFDFEDQVRLLTCFRN